MFIKVPNKIFKFNLTASEMLVYCGIVSFANRFGKATVKAEKIAKLCHVSKNTVYSAVSILVEKNLIVKTKRKYQHQNIANSYDVTYLSGGFCKLDTAVWGLELSPTSFFVYTYLLMKANKKGVSYPSLRVMQKDLGLSVDTIIDKIDYLSEVGLCSKMTVICQDGGFGCNNYKVKRTNDISVLDFLASTRKVCGYAIICVVRAFFVDGQVIKTALKKVLHHSPKHSLMAI